MNKTRTEQLGPALFLVFCIIVLGIIVVLDEGLPVSPSSEAARYMPVYVGKPLFYPEDCVKMVTEELPRGWTCRPIQE